MSAGQCRRYLSATLMPRVIFRVLTVLLMDLQWISGASRAAFAFNPWSVQSKHTCSLYMLAECIFWTLQGFSSCAG